MSAQTAIQPSYHLHSHYSEHYPQSHSIASSRHQFPGYSASNSVSEPRHAANSTQHKSQKHAPDTSTRQSQEMTPSRKKDRKPADWAKFYENGLPKEVIVIDDDDDDSPPPPTAHTRAPVQNQQSKASQHSTYDQHSGKRRRTDATSYDPVYYQSKTAGHKSPDAAEDFSTSSVSSTGRTATTGHQSTAPTSLTSTSSGGQQKRKTEDSHAVGQKRKRPQHEDDDESEIQVISQRNAWSNYVPPPKPPIKASDVYVNVVRDKQSASGSKCDDEDGHYIVNADTELTERYTISRLLGQGTFGKVVEAYDRKKRTKCAVKIIRAVPKYRDASRIELRVLATLASNDKHNLNRCIHLKDCFDYRNHICIVTDLLGESVFDFLKRNNFVPFPSTHIQSFARQLFTSVAFLHDLNLIHTDLKPENILLVNSHYQTFTYNRTIPSSSKSTSRQSKVRRVLLDPEIRLIDFGSATFDDEYHSSVVSTRHYRAPEIILNLGWSFPCDIWSIGCILVEFFTGDALFQTHDNLEHLAMMEAVCGAKIEREIIQQVRSGRSNNKNSAASYFLPRGYRLNYPNEETPRTSRKYVKAMKRLDETIPPATKFNLQFLDLLRRIFVYDPARRITAKEALQHPWFKETLQDDGTEALKIRLGKESKEREKQREREREYEIQRVGSSSYR